MRQAQQRQNISTHRGGLLSACSPFYNVPPCRESNRTLLASSPPTPKIPNMAQINENYLKLKAGYLFPEIGRRVAAYARENPQAKIIRMGIGDVTEPLPAVVREAMHKAVDEMGDRKTFRGYGPEQGYDFLREAIAKHD